MMYDNVNYDCTRYMQPHPYVEIVRHTISCDGTFFDINDLFSKLSISIKPSTDKEKIFNLYKECTYFGEEENKKLNEYIKSISVKEKENIFEYYD